MRQQIALENSAVGLRKTIVATFFTILFCSNMYFLITDQKQRKSLSVIARIWFYKLLFSKYFAILAACQVGAMRRSRAKTATFKSASAIDRYTQFAPITRLLAPFWCKLRPYPFFKPKRGVPKGAYKWSKKHFKVNQFGKFEVFHVW